MTNVTQTVRKAYEVTVTIPVVFTTVLTAANEQDARDVAIERALEVGSTIDFACETDGMNAHYEDGFDVDVARLSEED